MKHCMIDTETLGLTPGSWVRSIGACMFRPVSTADYDDERVIGETFYVNVIHEPGRFGLTEDAGTVEWWGRQSQEARDALEVDPKPLTEALWDFSAWFQRQGAVYPWSNGANFDQPLLEACYRAVDMQAPWRFYDSRCVRTLLSMGQIDSREYKSRLKGVVHNALDDAVHQARLCALAAGKLWPAERIV